MTIFASTDPYGPWKAGESVNIFKASVNGKQAHVVTRPGRAHDANPILVAVRAGADPIDAYTAREVLDALGGPGPEFDFDAWERSTDQSRHDVSVTTDDSHIAHARAVLTRYLSVFGGAA